MKTTIKTLYRKGYNKTQIGQMLGIDCKTVRKVLKEAEGRADEMDITARSQQSCKSPVPSGE